MKNIIYLFILSVTAFTISCDDSFLEENKKLINGYNLDNYLFVNPTREFTEVSITLTDLKNKDFKVLQYPKIIHFESFDGHIDETGKLSFRIKVDNFDSQVNIEPNKLGTIILNISDFGLLSIPVVNINYGTPKASVSKTSLDFDIDYTPKEFELSNIANGVLFYKLINKPSWIQISNYYSSSGSLELDSIMTIVPFGQISYQINPNVEGLAPGVHEGEITIETSDIENPILKIIVRIRVRSFENPPSVIPIDGKIMDCEFDKNTNTLFFITQDPAKLVIFDVNTKTQKEQLFNQNPYAISLSSDFKTILVGKSGELEFIERTTMNSKEKINVPYIVSDIIDGENGYYYYSNKEGEVFSFNITSKEIKNQPNLGNYGYKTEADILLKIKNKNQLAFSRTFLSPNGFYLIDASLPDQLKLIKYWHESFSYGNKILTSENFEYLFSFTKYIYKFPDENTGDVIYSLGELNLNKENFRTFAWMHHFAKTSSIWISYQTYDYTTYRFRGMISEFNDKTFSLKRNIELNDYVTTYNGVKNYFNTSADYFYVTNNGGELVLVKNIEDMSPDDNAWHLDVIDISQ